MERTVETLHREIELKTAENTQIKELREERDIVKDHSFILEQQVQKMSVTLQDHISHIKELDLKNQELQSQLKES